MSLSPLTIGCCVAIGAYFLIAVAVLALRTRQFSDLTAPLAREAGPAHGQNELSPIGLAKLWGQYQATLVPGLGKTRHQASEYFDERSVSAAINSQPWLARVRSVPNALVGLGLLGTFIGLTFGLKDIVLDYRDTAKMMESIRTLLKGTSTAFLTSIAGIVLSLLYNLLFLQPGLRALADRCDEITVRLDARYYVDEGTYLWQMLVGGQTTEASPPVGLLGVIVNQLEKQAQDLATLRSDVCQVVKQTGADLMSTWQVEQRRMSWELFVGNTGESDIMPKDVFSKMASELERHSVALDGFSTDLADSLKNIGEQIIDRQRAELDAVYREQLLPAVQALIAQKQESAGELIGTVVRDLSESMRSMVDQFQASLSGGAVRQIEELAQLVGKAGGDFGRIQEDQLFLVDQMRETVTQAVALFKSQAEASTQAMERIAQIQGQLQKVSGVLERATQAASEATDRLAAAGEHVVEQTRQLGESTSAALAKMQGVFEGSQAASKAFQTVEENLGEVFNTINNGLEQYREAVSDSLESYLQKYTDALNGFAQRLGGATEQLQESVDDLVESLAPTKVKS